MDDASFQEDSHHHQAVCPNHTTANIDCHNFESKVLTTKQTLQILKGKTPRVRFFNWLEIGLTRTHNQAAVCPNHTTANIDGQRFEGDNLSLIQADSANFEGRVPTKKQTQKMF